VSSERPLVVLGTTAFSEAVAESALLAGKRVECFVENISRERCRERLAGLPIRWIDDTHELTETHSAICGLGTTKRSIFVEQAANLGFRFETVIHPTAWIASTASIAEGSYIGPRVGISSSIRIGRHVIVLMGSLIGHHTVIGDYASVMMGARIAGSCIVGARTYIATGATVVDHITIGEYAVVGAGAVVVNDVPDRAQVVGVPARIVKKGIDGR
jgi:sugar O-acyltransferase (sialic acid O-acetyltransferase NeuD family)